MQSTKNYAFYIIAACWLAITITTVLFVPFNQGDELHYLGIAWNMFKAHSWLNTYYAAGAVDFEKTPLFYWPILAGWHLFGVNAVWPRVVTYSIGAINLILTYFLANQIFPENKNVGWLAVMALICNLFWPEYCGRIHFEGLVTIFGLLFLICLMEYIKTHKTRLLACGAVCFGLALFAKGGAVIIYFLPLAICLPLFTETSVSKQYLFDLTMTVSAALMIPAAWLAYVYFYDGSYAMHYILFTQVSKRVGLHFKIDQLAMFASSLLPTAGLFRSVHLKIDRKIFILIGSISIIVLFFSIAVMNQSKFYLTPVYPIMAIFLGYWISTKTKTLGWSLVFLSLFSLCFCGYNIFLKFGEKAKYQKNLIALAQAVRTQQLQGYAVAQFTDLPGYQNLDFMGRLPDDLLVLIKLIDQTNWIQSHPKGKIIHLTDKTDINGYQIKRGVTLSISPIP